MPISLSDIGKGAIFLLNVFRGASPFKITFRSDADPKYSLPILYVELANKTKDIPLFVHIVRINYGNKFYNHGFVLMPYGTVEIKPKSKKEFTISYDQPMITRSILTKSPNLPTPNNPNFDSSESLILAIANGNKNDSWLEVDFNEFKRRVFCRGRFKRIFQSLVDQKKRRLAEHKAN